MRIPKSFAVESKVEQGTTVDVRVENGNIVVKPIRKNKYTLEKLVDGIADDNRHSEIDWGRPVGREVV